MRYAVFACLAPCLLAACGSSSAPPPTGTRAAAPPPQTVQVPRITPPALPSQVPVATPSAPRALTYNATIHGTVSDSKTGSPIPGAIVALGIGGKTTKTNAFGAYSLPFPTGREVPVTVTVSSGFGGALAIGRLRPHQRYTLNFKLNPSVGGAPPVPSPPFHFGA